MLNEELPFLQGTMLTPGQHDAFFKPEVSAESGTLYEHAGPRAGSGDLAHRLQWLPLILGGDWNDGMNRVGIGGRGTSVWLGWFLAAALRKFLPYAQDVAIRRVSTAGRRISVRSNMRWKRLAGTAPIIVAVTSTMAVRSARTATWNARSTRRQSWSVLSGEGDPERQQQA